MNTKEKILFESDNLIRHRGYNSFSYADLSKAIGIKTSSIHYHFPSKTELGRELVITHQRNFQSFKEKYKRKTSIEQLKAFFSIYKKALDDKKICVMGTFASDYNTIDKIIQTELEILSDDILTWLSNLLQEGRNEGTFSFSMSSGVKALMIVTNMLSIIQLSRIIGNHRFEELTQAILIEIMK